MRYILLICESALERAGDGHGVALRDAPMRVSDGTSEERLRGHYVLETRDLDEAMSIAARYPGALRAALEPAQPARRAEASRSGPIGVRARRP